jgi:hypothetical protein
MNADHEEAVEFAKISKRENRVYVGNLSYDVKYRDLMEFMRGGGWGNLRSVFRKIVSSWGRKDVVWPGCGCVVVGECPWGTGLQWF